MAAYRLENVVLTLQDNNVKATADLMKSANGQPPWVIVESISTTVTASKDPREIAQAVGDFAKSIARRDNVINEVLAQAKALLEGAVVEL